MTGYFSANKTVTGGALLPSVDSKNGAVFLKFFKQTGYNPDNRSGDFDFKTPYLISLNQDEMGALISIVSHKSKLDKPFYHPYKDNITTLNFGYYKIEPKGEDKGREGFGLTVSRGKENPVVVKIGLTVGAAERLAEFLRFSLQRIFAAEYAEDKRKFQDQQKKAAQNKESQPSQESKSQVTDEQQDGWPSEQ